MEWKSMPISVINVQGVIFPRLYDLRGISTKVLVG